VSFFVADIAIVDNIVNRMFILDFIETEEKLMPETLFEKNKPRTMTVGFRTTPNDHEILHKAARDRGLTISEYLRDAARNLLKQNIAA